MTIAVTYAYDPARTDITDIRPSHRAYLGELYEAGTLLASGPWGDNGALLVFAGDDETAVREAVANDPFAIHGIISETVVAPWTTVYGPW